MCAIHALDEKWMKNKMKKKNNNKRALKEQKGTHRVNNWTEYSMLSYTRMLFPLVKYGMVRYRMVWYCMVWIEQWLSLAHDFKPQTTKRAIFTHITHRYRYNVHCEWETIHNKQPCVLENNWEQKQAKQKKMSVLLTHARAHTHTKASQWIHTMVWCSVAQWAYCMHSKASIQNSQQSGIIKYLRPSCFVPQHILLIIKWNTMHCTCTHPFETDVMLHRTNENCHSPRLVTKTKNTFIRVCFVVTVN